MHLSLQKQHRASIACAALHSKKNQPSESTRPGNLASEKMSLPLPGASAADFGRHNYQMESDIMRTSLHVHPVFKTTAAIAITNASSHNCRMTGCLALLAALPLATPMISDPLPASDATALPLTPGSLTRAPFTVTPLLLRAAEARRQSRTLPPSAAATGPARLVPAPTNAGP